MNFLGLRMKIFERQAQKIEALTGFFMMKNIYVYTIVRKIIKQQ